MHADQISESKFLEMPVPKYRVLAETEVIRPKPINIVFCTLLGLVSVGVGFVTWAHLLGKVSLLFGLILLATGFMLLFRGIGVLTIDSVGIHMSAGTGKQTLPWSTIAWIDESEMEVGLSKSKFVGIRLRDDGTEMGALRTANRTLAGFDYSIGDLYRVPVSELAELLQARLLKESPIPTQVLPRPMGGHQEPDEEPFDGDGIG